MLIHNKDDIESVTEFPCFFGFKYFYCYFSFDCHLCLQFKSTFFASRYKYIMNNESMKGEEDT